MTKCLLTIKTCTAIQKPGRQHPDPKPQILLHGFVGIIIIQIRPHLIFHWKIACHSCSKILKFLLKIFYWQFKVIFPHHKMLNCLYWLHCCLGFLHCCLDFLYVGDIAWKRSLSVINFVFSLFCDNLLVYCISSVKLLVQNVNCSDQIYIWNKSNRKKSTLLDCLFPQKSFYFFQKNLFILKNQTIDSKQCIGFSCLYSMQMYMF